MNNLENVKKVIEAAIAGDMNLNLDPKLVLAVVDECLAWRNEAQVHFNIRRDYPKLDYGPDVSFEHLQASLAISSARERTDKMLGGAE